MYTDRRHRKFVFTIYCIVYPGDMSWPFMCVIDRRHSKYVLTIYCIVYPGDMSGPLMCGNTDRRHSKFVYTIYCIVYPGDMSWPFMCVTDRRPQQVCITIYFIVTLLESRDSWFTCGIERRHIKYVSVIYCIVTRMACRVYVCVLPTDDIASMYLLFTVLFTRVACLDHFCVLQILQENWGVTNNKTAFMSQQVAHQRSCMIYTDRCYCKYVFTFYFIVYPGDMPGPFMCVTDRRNSKYVFIVYCCITGVACRDHLYALPTDDTVSLYLLCTVSFKGTIAPFTVFLHT